MEKHIVAIGGGGFGRNNSSYLIEKYILNLSETNNPKICFLPTASRDNDTYIVRYSIFSRLNCRPSHIEFFKRTINIKDHIMDQDIVFVGGGNTKSMLSIWNDWGMSDLLKDAYNRGVIIMSGVSAGAICWFTNGITDSWDNELRIIPCLDFVSGTCCPHYDEEPSYSCKKIIIKKKNK